MKTDLIMFGLGALPGVWFGFKAGRGFERVSMGTDLIRRILGK